MKKKQEMPSPTTNLVFMLFHRERKTLRSLERWKNRPEKEGMGRSMGRGGSKAAVMLSKIVRAVEDKKPYMKGKL